MGTENFTVELQHFRRQHICMFSYLWVALQNVLAVKRALLNSGHKSITRQYEQSHMGMKSHQIELKLVYIVTGLSILS